MKRVALKWLSGRSEALKLLLLTIISWLPKSGPKMLSTRDIPIFN